MLYSCLTLMLISSYVVVGAKDFMPIKVINELPNKGYNLYRQETKPVEKLHLRMVPRNFSGPTHLKELQGQCFRYTIESYEYWLCPFHNMTQQDIQTFYEPYKGVVGVWGEWIIENNNFVAMKMVEGSLCGNSTFRSAEVYFKCGPLARLLRVSEPKKCGYHAVLETPLVCGKNAMVVYPRLPANLQHEWDLRKTEKYNEEITEKGYQAALDQIFISAGYKMSQEEKSTFMEMAEKEKLVEEKNEEEEDICEVKVRTLEMRIFELELELRRKDMLLELGATDDNKIEDV
ncbi:N-acetylglucosamine-1-phosphotransferase subunit gamma-like isoform X2 [Oratosquilla oratoria]|uniref:N-acetylglucosamine-1-phosphotransferase subunit gamma-like isoform X2 n=1 Tax=Oratosquilla oratoria TaxID=337810 RepID=UPI003F766758